MVLPYLCRIGNVNVAVMIAITPKPSNFIVCVSGIIVYLKSHGYLLLKILIVLSLMIVSYYSLVINCGTCTKQHLTIYNLRIY